MPISGYVIEIMKRMGYGFGFGMGMGISFKIFPIERNNSYISKKSLPNNKKI